MTKKPYRVTRYNRKQFYCLCCKKYRFSALTKELGPSFGTRPSAFMGFCLVSGLCGEKQATAPKMKEGINLQREPKA